MHYFKTFAKGILSCLALVISVWAQSTQFTYQGSLQDGGSLANGTYDLEFALFDSQAGGNQVGSTISRPGVNVDSGTFSVALDFGDQFPGTPRFLEIRVRQSGGGAFTVLSPRQAVNSAPYSVRSIESETSQTAVSATTAANSTSSINFTGGLNGDVTGTQGATTVARIQGRNVANTLPVNGQVLKYDSSTSQWKPAADESGGGGSTITAITPGAGLTGGGTSGSVSLGIANGGVGTPQIADGSVTDAKIAAVSGAKITGTVANAINSTQLGGVPAASYLQGVVRNSTLSGSGTPSTPLGIALPLDLAGNVNGLGLVTVNNSSPNTNAIYASVNGVNSSCPNCAAIRGTNTGNGSGLFGSTAEESDGSAGVEGSAPNGNGVLGSGARAGVLGIGLSSAGNGVYGIAHASEWSGVAAFHSSTGNAISGLSVAGTAIRGFSSTGYAGYFDGRSYFSGNAGFGILTPTERLHVSGNGLISGRMGIGVSNAVSRLHASESAATPTARFENFGTGEAVFAQGTSTTGRLASSEAGVLGTGNTGVIGRTSGSGNPAPSVAVLGEATSSAGSTTGVWGTIESPAGAAVRGWANGTAGATIGVEGKNLSTNASAVGVLGIAAAQATGVLGTSTSGRGVIGRAGTSSDWALSPAGVWGDSAAGVGVYGSSNSSSGVRGDTLTGYGVLGQSSSGGIGGGFLSSPIAVDAQAFAGRNVYLGGGGSTGSEIKFRRDDVAHYSIYNNGSLTFANTSSNFAPNTPGTPLMVITNAGNVGIGTNAPGFRLHVNGATRTGTLAIDSFFAGTSGFTLCANTGNNQVGLCPASSLRYKKNVANLNTGLETIMRLRPVKFDWKESGDPDLGLVAEEVAKADPLLALFRDGNIEGVKYDRIPVVLINAVKEQQAQIKQHEATIKKQQAQIDALLTLACRRNAKAKICLGRK